jgi:hypothetical protein
LEPEGEEEQIAQQPVDDEAARDGARSTPDRNPRRGKRSNPEQNENERNLRHGDELPPGQLSRIQRVKLSSLTSPAATASIIAVD